LPVAAGCRSGRAPRRAVRFVGCRSRGGVPSWLAGGGALGCASALGVVAAAGGSARPLAAASVARRAASRSAARRFLPVARSRSPWARCFFRPRQVVLGWLSL
jgi:hypothetical protein